MVLSYFIWASDQNYYCWCSLGGSE
jgi:hypothetical protein